MFFLLVNRVSILVVELSMLNKTLSGRQPTIFLLFILFDLNVLFSSLTSSFAIFVDFPF